MLELKDLTESKKLELLNLFIQIKEVKEALGNCPSESERVEEHTDCYYCEECWIAAIAKSLDSKK